MRLIIHLPALLLTASALASPPAAPPAATAPAVPGPFRPIIFAPGEEGPARLLTLPAASAPLAAAPLRADSTLPTLLGTIINSKTGADGSAALGKGMYRLDASGTFTRLNTNGNAQYGGAPMANGFYYATNKSGVRIYSDKFNTSTWKRATHTSVTGSGIMASDVALDPTSDFVYGCFYNDDANGYVFGRIDYTNRRRQAIRPLEMAYNAVMADNAGTVYAIDMTGRLFRLDKRTGDATLIGHTGVTPLYASSGAIDPATGRCFWTVNPADGGGYLYEVNLSTGAATLLTTFPHSDEITGLYVPWQPADGAPGPATGMKAEFADGAMSGTVSLTAPLKSGGGTDLTDSLGWRLWVDGILYASGTVAPGAPLSIPVAASLSGRTPFVAGFTNAAGEGERVNVKVFVGNDTPLAPKPSLEYAAGAFRVSWPAVTGAVNSGYIDPARVTYSVRRLPDGVDVASGISACEWTDTVAPTPGRVIAYKYEVRATFEGNRGAAGTTPVYPLGEIETPWHEGFDSPESMNNFIIIDADADGKTWQYSPSMSSAYITDAAVRHDDWLLSAAIRMEAGVTYRLSFQAMASFYPERIEVRMGRAATPDSMTTVLVPPTELAANFSMEPQVPEFTVAETGVYHIGWHAISDANSFYLYVDNIALTDNRQQGATPVDPPYARHFDESAELSEFTVVDANNDGYMWNVSDGRARVHSGSSGADDWMITRPLRLRAGSRYALSLRAAASAYASERIEVKGGLSPRPDSLTDVLVAPVDITGADYVRIAAWLLPQTDCDYYVGVHGCSPEGYELYVDDVAVASPVTAGSASAPGALTLEPAPYGALSATLSLTAPSLRVDGAPLSSIDRVEVLYADSVVHTFTAPAPGASLTCGVAVPAFGVHEFTAVAHNEAGAGIPASVSGYVGINRPAAPGNLRVGETANPGEVTLRWQAPAADVEGRPLLPSQIKYIVVEIVNGQQLLLARDIADTLYTLQAVAPGAPQQFKTYGVIAATEAGNGQGVAGAPVVVGAPYQAPWVESFAGGALTSAMLPTQLVPTMQWTLYRDGMADVSSVDADNGFLVMETSNAGATGALLTGRVSLTGLKEPALDFHVYHFPDSLPNHNRVMAQMMTDDGQMTQLCDFDMSERLGTAEYGWRRVSLDLSPWRGRTVRFAIGGTAANYVYLLFDRFSVEDKNPGGVSGTESGAPRVESVEGGVRVTGAAGARVDVCDIDGRAVWRGVCPSDSHTLRLAPGVYIVRVGADTVKVLVR